jgi:hypothetical protein
MSGNGTNILNLPVPILGQQVKIHGAHLMVVLTCGCRADAPPLLIRGVDVRAACPACGNVYGIVRGGFDARQSLNTSIEVALIGKANAEVQRGPAETVS